MKELKELKPETHQEAKNNEDEAGLPDFQEKFEQPAVEMTLGKTCRYAAKQVREIVQEQPDARTVMLCQGRSKLLGILKNLRNILNV